MAPDMAKKAGKAGQKVKEKAAGGKDKLQVRMLLLLLLLLILLLLLLLMLLLLLLLLLMLLLLRLTRLTPLLPSFLHRGRGTRP